MNNIIIKIKLKNEWRELPAFLDDEGGLHVDFHGVDPNDIDTTTPLSNLNINK